MIDEIQKFRIVNKLKDVYRMAPVYDSGRNESTAEHTWSSLLLADLLYPLVSDKVNKLKAYELIMYHDLVEIETGDTPMQPSVKQVDKSELEMKAAKKLSEELPNSIKEKYFALFEEYEAGETLEAKFAKCIDIMDAQINFLDYKDARKGWKSEHLRVRKKEYFEAFPKLNEVWEELLQWTIDNGYLEE